MGVSAQVALDEAPRLISGEAEDNVQAINITGVQADGVTSLCSRIAILQEVIGYLWRTGIKDKTVVLEDKGRELKTTNETERIRVHHILVGQHHVILCSGVIRQVVIENEIEETI